jgi:hypothetical protein
LRLSGAPQLAAALLAAELVSVSDARGDDACAEDIRTFCGDVKVGSGRPMECLKQNEPKLSPGCRAQRSDAAARFRRIAEEFVTACGRDIKRLCGEVKPGSGRILACLTRQQDDLTSSCRPQIERAQAAAEKIAAVRAACTADAERLCGSLPAEAGSLVECLTANRADLSDTCRSLGPEAALVPAELVDALNSLKTEEWTREGLQILQGVESSIAFTRSQILFQFDTYHGFGGRANADRLLLNAQIAFGSRREFAFQVRAPVFAVYPYAPGSPAQTGLGAVDTALAWEFLDSERVHQFLSLGFQWISPEAPPVGAAWAINPGYAIAVSVAEPLSVTGQVIWIRSFASVGYPEINLMILEPIVVVNLPERSFISLDTRLGWNFVDSSFLPLIKGIVGLYLDRRKSAAISAWYQTLLSNAATSPTPPGTLAFKFGVGTALDYFFDW